MEHGKSSVLTGLISLPLWEVNKKNNNNNNAYVMHKLLIKKKVYVNYRNTSII